MEHAMFNERALEYKTKLDLRPLAMILALAIFGAPASSQIQKISICQPGADSPQHMTCRAGGDTQQLVMASNGQPSINLYAGSGITDEHSSVLPPGTVRLADGTWNTDYLFFVASDAADVVQAQRGPDIGVLVLSAAGPQPSAKVGSPALTNSTTWDPNFQWTMGFASADGYGTYCDNFGTNCTQGTVFLPPIFQGNCPQPASPPFSNTNRSLPPDTTFDLSYAAAGSIVPDPTGVPGSMLMIYEGANGCSPIDTTQVTINMGVATSDDYGRTWPTYRGYPYCAGGAGPFCDAFEFYDLPYNNPYQGPRQGAGAAGPGVCKGNDCNVTPPLSYGRYEILHAVAGEPSAFVDAGNPNSSSPPYMYMAVHLLAGGIGVAKAQLGRHDQLRFETFNGLNPVTGKPNWVSAGNSPSPQMLSILAAGTDAAACQGKGKGSQPQLSYYPPTGEYVLTFVCTSHGDPAGSDADNPRDGSAWFWSTTTDLESQHWSTPKQIYGSWNEWTINSDKNGPCASYNGWYPTFMSLGQAPGEISQNGYVFYMIGGLGCTPPLRQYASRAFTISTIVE